MLDLKKILKNHKKSMMALPFEPGNVQELLRCLQRYSNFKNKLAQSSQTFIKRRI